MVVFLLALAVADPLVLGEIFGGDDDGGNDG